MPEVKDTVGKRPGKKLNKRARQRWNGLTRGGKLMAFFLVLVVMGFIGLLWFARPDTSTVEKRSLTQFPAFSWGEFWDGTYFKKIDTWYADTYPLREGLITANQWLTDKYGLRGDQIVGEAMVSDEIPTEETPDAKPEIDITPDGPLDDGTVTNLGELQGQIYITDNCGYGLYYFTQDGADAMAAAINQIYDRVGDQVELYTMICPISSGVMLDQAVLEDMGCSDEKAAIDYVYKQLNEGIHTVNAFDNLKLHNAEYIYFHTDHHWTALGAYYAYQVFCKEKGVQPHDYKDYETMEFPDFLGTFYGSSNRSPALAANPDTVVAYIPKGTNTCTMTNTDGSTVQWPIVNDVSNYAKSELYAAFGADKPFTVAHNETITDGSAVMVIKDSYGNAFIPWLIDHYEYVYWVDYRYTSNTISQMVQDYGVQDVIISLQIYNATTKSAISKLVSIGQ